MRPLELHDDQIDVEAIQEAIRARVRRREAGRVEVRREEFEENRAARLRPLADWDFPAATWHAMWPPHLEPWNLDQDYAIRSHRGPIGATIVACKVAWRGVARWLLRPLLVQQVLVNRTLAQIARALSDELSRAELERRALERRLARVGEVVRELRGDAQPLVRFSDDPER